MWACLYDYRDSVKVCRQSFVFLFWLFQTLISQTHKAHDIITCYIQILHYLFGGRLWPVIIVNVK
jgi:hypothetical protein